MCMFSFVFVLLAVELLFYLLHTRQLKQHTKKTKCLHVSKDIVLLYLGV